MRLTTLLAFVSSVILCEVMICSHASILNQRIFALDTVAKSGLVEARKKKKDKYALSIILAALMVKTILFPLAFKAMAVMSSVAVMLSTMSLIATSIIGYTKLAWSKIGHPHHPIKVVRYNDAWAKDDEVIKNYGDDFGYDTIGPVEEHLHYYQRRKSS